MAKSSVQSLSPVHADALKEVVLKWSGAKCWMLCRVRTPQQEGAYQSWVLGECSGFLRELGAACRGHLSVEPSENHDACRCPGGAAVQRHFLLCIWIPAD